MPNNGCSANKHFLLLLLLDLDLGGRLEADIKEASSLGSRQFSENFLHIIPKSCPRFQRFVFMNSSFSSTKNPLEKRGSGISPISQSGNIGQEIGDLVKRPTDGRESDLEADQPTGPH